MHRTISRADVEALESDDVDLSVKAERLAAWAEDGEVDHAADVSAQSLLATAAELLGIAGDRDAQWDVLDRAERAEGRSAIDILAYRVEALFARGADDAARATADDLRRARTANPFTCHFMAEVFADRDEPKTAERWFNIGLRTLEAIDPEMGEEPTWDLLLVGRRRLREGLGGPGDEYDQMAEAISSLHGREA